MQPIQRAKLMLQLRVAGCSLQQAQLKCAARSALSQPPQAKDLANLD
jgi:hypothetical protein